MEFHAAKAIITFLIVFWSRFSKLHCKVISRTAEISIMDNYRPKHPSIYFSLRFFLYCLAATPGKTRDGLKPADLNQDRNYECNSIILSQKYLQGFFRYTFVTFPITDNFVSSQRLEKQVCPHFFVVIRSLVRYPGQKFLKFFAVFIHSGVKTNMDHEDF